MPTAARASPVHHARVIPCAHGAQTVTEWAQFVPTLNEKNIISAPWCEEVKCEEDIKANSARQYVFAKARSRPSLPAQARACNC